MSICDPGARVDETGLAYKGSMLQLQMYVNRYPAELNLAVADALGVSTEITWVSPLASTSFAEYRDESFLRALGLGRYEDRLANFWPKRGPCWDGLGLIEIEGDRSPLLVEAKSYPMEGYSSISAKSQGSIRTIEDALTASSAWLGLHELSGSWTEGRYQTANRLAHLYFLREVLGVDAHLVFVPFVDDPTHNPAEIEAWRQASSQMWIEMGFTEVPPFTGVAYLSGLGRDKRSAV